MHASLAQRLRFALKDLADGVAAIHVWPMFGWMEIKQRYRRSLLGPFWLTLSTGIMIAGMGPLYSRFLGQPMAAYFPHIAISLVLWQLIASLVNDACTAFIAAEGYIKQMKLPLTIHVLREVWRNLIVFAHNFVIVLLVLFFYPPRLDAWLLLAPLGVLLIVVNGVWAGLLLGLLCARFRDIPQIVSNLMQVAFFLTPVFWSAEMLGHNRWAAEANPLFHFLEIVRRPLAGEPPSALSWAVVLAVTAAGFLVALAFFQRFRARIAYWV